VRKLFNSAESMVDDMIDGFVAAFAQVRRGARDPRIVVRARPKPASRVRLLIGNGAGHEPIAMGFVGEGLLDANVVGDVFAAPSADLILDGLREVAGEAGSLLLISQHSGDVINGRAAAMLAGDEGLRLRVLLMHDDISSAPKGREAERRGAAGTMFVYKILGAAAEAGMDLDALAALGGLVLARTRTLAAAVSPGISPLTGQPMFALPEGEIYLGMGVHGEPGMGRARAGPVGPLVARMVAALLGDRPVASGRAAVIVNGMGGTTLMELLTVYRETVAALAAQGIAAVAPMVGSYVTTQEMGGFSISLLEPDDEMLRLWGAPSDTPYFPRIGDA
jgi:dihydroxyacetone kinase-like protein